MGISHYRLISRDIMCFNTTGAQPRILILLGYPHAGQYGYKTGQTLTDFDICISRQHCNNQKCVKFYSAYDEQKIFAFYVKFAKISQFFDFRHFSEISKI